MLVFGDTIKRHLNNNGEVCPSTTTRLETYNEYVIYQLICPNCFATQYRDSIEETICTHCGKAF